MSILGSIISKIFHGQDAATAAPAPKSDDETVKAATPAEAAAKTTAPKVDVAAMLDNLAARDPRGLNWRVSIVDMMALLKLDSSHAARVELAKELHYTGDLNNSAPMNIWLHGQVMQKLADNGGIVPEDLKKF